MRYSHDYPPQRRERLVIWAFLLILVVFGALLLRHFLVASAPPPLPAEPVRQLRTVTLYFASADGTGLVAEGREMEGCLIEEDCLKATIQALLDGPVGDLAPVLPAQATLIGARVTGPELQVDFSRALLDNHPGGSTAELLTIYALADTVAVNFPHLRQLRILVEGVAVETLKGHVDLRQPVIPDFALIVNSAAGVPPAAPAGSPR